MNTSKYRKSIAIAEYNVEEVAEFLSEKDSVIPKYIVDEMLDDIETRINDILSSLSEIKGLTEIDDMSHDLKELSGDLY